MADQDIEDLILQTRKFIVHHSYIYYRLYDSLVSDAVFDAMSRELVRLQRQHPEEAQSVDFYSEYFKDWDGSSGFDIPFQPEEVEAAKEALARS